MTKYDLNSPMYLIFIMVTDQYDEQIQQSSHIWPPWKYLTQLDTGSIIKNRTHSVTVYDNIIQENDYITYDKIETIKITSQL
jgi:hypothetical protein